MPAAHKERPIAAPAPLNRDLPGGPAAAAVPPPPKPARVFGHMQLCGEKNRGAGFGRLSGPRAEAARQRQRQRRRLGPGVGHCMPPQALLAPPPFGPDVGAGCGGGGQEHFIDGGARSAGRPVGRSAGRSDMASRRRCCAICAAASTFFGPRPRARAAAPSPPSLLAMALSRSPPGPPGARLAAGHGRTPRDAGAKYAETGASARCCYWCGRATRWPGGTAPRSPASSCTREGRGKGKRGGGILASASGAWPVGALVADTMCTAVGRAKNTELDRPAAGRPPRGDRASRGSRP